MKVLLISGSAPVPQPLRDVIARGSTSVEERQAADLEQRSPPLDVDRAVFWAGSGDVGVMNVANKYLGTLPERRGDKLVFVMSQESRARLSGVAAGEVFVWPQDEDRFKMAFMTGA